jgi:hypothetical protein
MFSRRAQRPDRPLPGKCTAAEIEAIGRMPLSTLQWKLNSVPWREQARLFELRLIYERGKDAEPGSIPDSLCRLRLRPAACRRVQADRRRERRQAEAAALVRRRKTEQCEQFLRSLLSPAGHHVPAKEVKAATEDAGHTWATVRVVKKRRHIRSERTAGRWFWFFPAEKR